MRNEPNATKLKRSNYYKWGENTRQCKGSCKGRSKFQNITDHEGPERGEDYCSTPSLTLALDSGRVVNATPRQFHFRERDQVFILQWFGWATGPLWTGAENLALTEIRSSDLPAHSESLYRLSYPGPNVHVIIQKACQRQALDCTFRGSIQTGRNDFSS
jgi:hypothetical protein